MPIPEWTADDPQLRHCRRQLRSMAAPHPISSALAIDLRDMAVPIVGMRPIASG